MRGHPYVLDVAYAVVLSVINVLGLGYSTYAGIEFREPDLWGILLNVLAAFPLVWRRRFPLTTAVIVLTAYMTLGFLAYSSTGGSVAALIAIYTLGTHAPVMSGLGVTIGTAAVSGIYLHVNHERFAAAGIPSDLWTVTVQFFMYVGLWIIARAVRARRLYLKELEDRAERLQRTASAELRAALAEERARMARELHDVVAHHISVMTVQAAGARRMLSRDPDRSIEAMRAVEETGRSALDEMRRIVGALRHVDAEEPPTAAAELAPQAGVAELDALMGRARETGLDVGLTVVGEPRTLPPSLDLAIFRVVQEALTNTLKHAGPTRAAVVLRYEPTAVVVSVTDDGAQRWHGGAPRPASADRVGHGLVGMRERVTLNGGTLRTGPRSVGGFEVQASLPLEEVTV